MDENTPYLDNSLRCQLCRLTSTLSHGSERSVTVVADRCWRILMSFTTSEKSRGTVRRIEYPHIDAIVSATADQDRFSETRMWSRIIHVKRVRVAQIKVLMRHTDVQMLYTHLIAGTTFQASAMTPRKQRLDL